MEEITVENNLDKECSALGGLFQHIVDETKVGHWSLITVRDSFWRVLTLNWQLFFFNLPYLHDKYLIRC